MNKARKEVSKFIAQMSELLAKQERKDINEVTFKDKKYASIATDLQIIDNAIVATIAYYVKGFQDTRRNKGLGAEHIKLHLDKGSQGEITLEELLNLGQSLRTYNQKFEKPFKSERELYQTATIYEWQDEAGVRFRVVIDTIYQGGGRQLPLSPLASQIITFYSDRNLNERMEFKNPKVKEYYENLEQQNEVKANKNKIPLENEPLVFIGKKQVECAIKFITNDFIYTNATKLEPSDSLFSFLQQSQNYKNRDKILNHFADKLTVKDENGVYSGEGIQRFRYLNYIIPTMQEPLIKIIRDDNRQTYFKPFLDNKDKIIRFISITENVDIDEIFITAFKAEDNKNIKRLMREARVIEFKTAPADTLTLSARDKTFKMQGSNTQTIPNPTLKNTESPNIQSFLGIDYGNISKHTQDKFAQIEKQASDNLACASGIDDTALNTLKTKGEKDLSKKHNNEIKEKKKQRIK